MNIDVGRQYLRQLCLKWHYLFKSNQYLFPLVVTFTLEFICGAHFMGLCQSNIVQMFHFITSEPELHLMAIKPTDGGDVLFYFTNQRRTKLVHFSGPGRFFFKLVSLVATVH